MTDKVDKCPYCEGTYPHVGPTGCLPDPAVTAYKARQAGTTRKGSEMSEQFSIAVYGENGKAVAFRQVNAYGPWAAVQQLMKRISSGDPGYGLTTATAPTTIPAPAALRKVFVVLSLETDPDRIEFGEVRSVSVTSEPPALVESHHQVYEVDVDGKATAYRTN